MSCFDNMKFEIWMFWRFSKPRRWWDAVHRRILEFARGVNLAERYDIVRTNLNKRDYHETEERMLHAIMSLVVSYVERQMYLGADCILEQDEVRTNCDLLRIYTWWKFEYADELAELDRLCDEDPTDDEDERYFEYDNWVHNKENEMMCLAVKLRGGMWS